MADENVGPDIVNYYIQVATQEYMVKNELTAACRDYPHAKIMGIVPKTFVGDLLGFTTDKIEEMRQAGYRDAVMPLVDMCEGYPRRFENVASSGSGPIIIAAACGTVGGALLMLGSSSAISYCRRRRNW